MANSIEVGPRFNEGDTVVYTDDLSLTEYLSGDIHPSSIGKVLKVEKEIVTTYRYTVEWVDEDPTDTYTGDKLAPLPPGLTALDYFRARGLLGPDAQLA